MSDENVLIPATVQAPQVGVDTPDVLPRPLTIHPNTSLPPSAPQELVQKVVDNAHVEAPATGYVSQEVVVKELPKAGQ